MCSLKFKQYHLCSCLQYISLTPVAWLANNYVYAYADASERTLNLVTPLTIGQQQLLEYTELCVLSCSARTLNLQDYQQVCQRAVYLACVLLHSRLGCRPHEHTELHATCFGMCLYGHPCLCTGPTES